MTMTPLSISVAILIAGAALSAGGAATWRHGHTAGTTEVQQRWDKATAAASIAAALASEDARERERLYQSRQREVTQNADNQNRAIAPALRRVADADDSLRQRAIDAIAARCSGGPSDPAIARPGEAAAAAANLCADMLGRVAAAAGQFAAVAQVRGVAGTACQRSYEVIEAEHSEARK